MGKPVNFAQELLFREVLESVAEAEKAKTLDELHAVFRPVLRHFGFTLFAGIEIQTTPLNPTVRVAFGDGYELWFAYYASRGYAKDDPLIAEAARSHDPFFWSDIVEREDLSTRAKQIVDDARNCGLRDGFIAPLHKLDGSTFAVMLAGAHCDRHDHYARAAALLLATYYGMVGRHLHYGPALVRADAITLTDRQLECLRWAREGKSSNDIGTILGISIDVVDEH